MDCFLIKPVLNKLLILFIDIFIKKLNHVDYLLGDSVITAVSTICKTDFICFCAARLAVAVKASIFVSFLRKVFIRPTFMYAGLNSCFPQANTKWASSITT